MKCDYVLPIFLFVVARIDMTIQFQRPCEDLSEECLTRSFQMVLPRFMEGIPELGLETLDPYIIDRLDLVLPGGLSIQFSQGVARGLKNCNVDFVRLVGDTLELQLHCNLTIKGKYKSLGKLLTFPIDGHGDSMIKCKNIKLHNVFRLKSKMAPNGEKYLEIAAVNTDHSYDGRIYYNLTNLLRGNPDLSKALLDFMNDNWLMVAQEFGDPLVEFGVTAVLKNLKLLLSKIPMNQLFSAPLNL